MNRRGRRSLQGKNKLPYEKEPFGGSFLYFIRKQLRRVKGVDLTAGGLLIMLGVDQHLSLIVRAALDLNVAEGGKGEIDAGDQLLFLEIHDTHTDGRADLAEAESVVQLILVDSAALGGKNIVRILELINDVGGRQRDLPISLADRRQGECGDDVVVFVVQMHEILGGAIARRVEIEQPVLHVDQRRGPEDQRA